jgi:hypothetical protein
MHGGTNKGAPSGNRNAWKHGDRSAEAEQQLKTVKATDRDLRIFAKIQQAIELRSSELDRLAELLVERVHSPGSSKRRPT